MPNKDAAKPPSQWGAPKFKPGQLVNVFNFDAENINLAPSECFSHHSCKGCPGQTGSKKCNFQGPNASKNDILTVIDARPADEDGYQLVLLLTPNGTIGCIDNEMLDYVPEMIPEEEKLK